MLALALLAAGAAASDGPSCKHPLFVGEIHPYASEDKCMDIEGYDGMGQLGWSHCGGSPDQQFIFCQDGSIRNAQINYCLVPEALSFGMGRVFSQPCMFNDDDTLKDQAAWVMYNKRMWKDRLGIQQMIFALKAKVHWKNKEWAYTYNSNIGMQEYDNLVVQYWYFRSRGELLNSGRLVGGYDHPDQLIGFIKNRDPGRIIADNPRADDMEQVWEHYANGEIRNVKTGMCLGMRASDKRNYAWYCNEKEPGQHWNLGRQNQGEYFPIVTRIGDWCIPTGKGQTLDAQQCTWTRAQYHKWDSDTSWEKASAQWNFKGCNEGGSAKITVTSSRTYDETFTADMTAEVSTTIKEGIVFAEAEVSMSVAMSIGTSFSHTTSTSETMEMECQYYGDGTDFTTGCMWQWELSTVNKFSKKPMTWTPLWITCTRNQDPPQCPPFQKCTDENCTGCEDKKNPMGVPELAPGEDPPPPGLQAGGDNPTDFEGGAPAAVKDTYAAYRLKPRCKDLAEPDCDARADCKSKKKGHRFKKCKAESCSKLKTHKACIEAHKPCEAVVALGGAYKMCRKDKRD